MLNEKDKQRYLRISPQCSALMALSPVYPRVWRMAIRRMRAPLTCSLQQGDQGVSDQNSRSNPAGEDVHPMFPHDTRRPRAWLWSRSQAPLELGWSARVSVVVPTSANDDEQEGIVSSGEPFLFRNPAIVLAVGRGTNKKLCARADTCTPCTG